MEPNKIENQIREKLNAREIQPSSQAWDRLDAMLSVQEESVKKSNFPWMKVAAGFILFLGIGYLFLIQNESPIQKMKNNVEIVESTSKDASDSIETNREIIQNDVITNKKAETILVAKEKSDKKSPTKQELFILPNKNKTEEYKTAITEVRKEKTEEKQNVIIKNEAPINIENKEVIAENKVTSKPKLKVDANALLNQVEGEATLTFRQKVMKTVAKNYNDARESFASRNIEQSSNNH